MGQTPHPAVLDSDGEFWHEKGLTFEDLLVGDRFSVGEGRYKKLTENTAARVDMGPDVGGFGTFLPSQAVARYGNFEPFGPGLYVMRLPLDPDEFNFNCPFARLPVGEVFTLSDPSVFYRKLTPTKAVRLNPSSPLLKKALNPEAGS